MENSQLALFDYQALDLETRVVVQQRAGEIRDLMRSTAENIMRVGEKLLEVQVKLGNGSFDAWLSAEFDWSRRTAYNFISVFREFQGRANFAQINIATSALYLLSAPSTPDEARQEAIERAEAGETITHAKAREIVAEHKPPAPTFESVAPVIPMELLKPVEELEAERYQEIVIDSAAGPAPWEEDDDAGEDPDSELEIEAEAEQEDQDGDEDAEVESAVELAVGQSAGVPDIPRPLPPPPPITPAAPPPPPPVVTSALWMITVSWRPGLPLPLVTLGCGGEPRQAMPVDVAAALHEIIEARTEAPAPPIIKGEAREIPVATPEWLIGK